MKCNLPLLLITFLFAFSSSIAQTYVIDTIQDDYAFINWKANKIKMAESSPTFKKLFRKFDTILNGAQEDLHIFHIGGSHIQADIYSNRLRSYLQTMSPNAVGQRGFIFPYKIAKTNNPGNYRVEYDGNWKGYRCSVNRDSVPWGLAGVTAVFKDSIAHVKIKANGNNYHENLYDFNRIRIFYDNWTDDYQILFKENDFVISEDNNPVSYTHLTLPTTSRV